MNTQNKNFYNFVLAPGTRDHRGFFAQDGVYNLVHVESSGWAFVCLDNHTCYYVDPENLFEVCDLEESHCFKKFPIDSLIECFPTVDEHPRFVLADDT